MRILRRSILLLMFIFVGCDTTLITYGIGEIIKIDSSAASLVDSSGALFGNESVKFRKPTLVLSVEVTTLVNTSGNIIKNKSQLGIYVMQVYGNNNKSVLAMISALKKGDKIKFLVSKILRMDQDYIYFSDKIGYNYTTQIIRL